jgi:hypothetical protein
VIARAFGAAYASAASARDTIAEKAFSPSEAHLTALQLSRAHRRGRGSVCVFNVYFWAPART